MTQPKEDAFYHACEQGDTSLLDRLYEPGFENMVNHKLDFEDAAGLQWFLDRGVDVNRRPRSGRVTRRSEHRLTRGWSASRRGSVPP